MNNGIWKSSYSREKSRLEANRTVMHGKCPVCAKGRLEQFFELAEVPVYCNVLWPTQDAALQCPRGNIQLAFCRHCGFIANLAFDPQRLAYDQNYENSLHFSPQFQKYAQALATHLISRYELQGKDIIEIGCGKGEFLALLCALGNNCGFGFDPSYVNGRVDAAAGTGITFVRDFYSERYASYPCDFICCRQTLEHIHDPVAFLTCVRRIIGERSHIRVFFEVPNVLFTLQAGGIWDIIYEHCSYFCPSSLAYLFNFCGFDVGEIRETFGGQFLTLEALPSRGIESQFAGDHNVLLQLAQDMIAFQDRYRQRVQRWRQKLEVMKSSRKRVVAWGAGSKGVTFLNTFGSESAVQYVVDINPHKQGKFIPGTGQEVVSPEFLRAYWPDFVLVLNSNYCIEIEKQIAELGLHTKLMAV